MPPPAHTPAATGRGGGGGVGGAGDQLRSPSLVSPSSPIAPSTTTTSSNTTQQSPPPLPSSLVPQVDSLERILEDLQSYQIPQLGDCRGPKSLFDQLTNQVRGELSRVRRDLDELKLDVEDLIKVREREIGNWYIDQLQRELEVCTKLYRSTVVQAKRFIDSSQHYLNREELLAPTNSNSSKGNEKESGASGEDALMSATSDVTEGLRRTLQLLQSEVDRSQVSNELLEQQTQTISSTSQQYSTLSTLLHNSKTLITSLERADVLDRLILFGAFSFFIGVCSYIFKKRVVDRGLKVASTVSEVLSKASRGGSHRTTEQVVKEVVKEEFKVELEKVAIATAAVLGGFKKAKDLVNEKLRERKYIDEKEEESVFDKVKEQIKAVTESIPTRSSVTPTTTFTSPSSSSSQVISPSHTAEPIVPQEQEVESEYTEPFISEEEEEESIEEQEPQEAETIFYSSSFDDNLPPPSQIVSPTSAIDLPEPTTSTSLGEEEEEVYSPPPEPTLAPPIPEPSPEQPRQDEQISKDTTEGSEGLDELVVEKAEPEAEILPPQTPESTFTSIGTIESTPSPSPSPSLDDTVFEPINPRQVVPPVPAHSLEELEEEIFDSSPPPSSSEPSPPIPSSGSEPSPASSNDQTSREVEEDDISQQQPVEEEFELESIPIPSATIDLDPLPSPSPEDNSLSLEEEMELNQELQQTTTPLETVINDEEAQLNPETIPRLDVEETGQVPPPAPPPPSAAASSDEEVESKSELPIDLEKEQSVWEEESLSVEEEEGPIKEEKEELVRVEEDEEKLLEDMFERQMGGTVVGGFVGTLNVTTIERGDVKPEEKVEGIEIGGEQVDSESQLPKQEEEEELSTTNRSMTSTQEVEEFIPEAPVPEAVPQVSEDSSFSTPAPLDASPSPLSEHLAVAEAPLSTALPQEATPNSSLVYESIPSPSPSSPPTLTKPLQGENSFTPEDEVLNHEDTITEPSIPVVQIEQGEEDTVEPSSIQLPVQSSTPSSSSSSDLSSEIPIATGESVPQVEEPTIEEEEEEDEKVFVQPVETSPSPEEANSVIDDVPTPSPVPTPEISHIPASPNPEPVHVPKEEEEDEQIQPERENPLPPPSEESVPSPSSLSSEPLPSISQTPIPEPTTSSPVPSPTQVSEPVLSQEEESLVYTEEDEEDVPNSDVVYPPADIDEPTTTTTEEREFVEDLPIFEGVDTDEEDEKEGEGEVDDNKAVVVDDTQLPLHVEL